MVLIHDENPDIIGITETSPKNGAPIQPKEIDIPGFECFINLHGRSTCLYVRTSLNPQEHFTEGEGEPIGAWCALRLRDGDKLLIGCVYRSPSNQSADDIHFINQLNTSHFLCMGDFNFPQIDWNSETCLALAASASSKFLDCT